jgi:hypothetical protein
MPYILPNLMHFNYEGYVIKVICIGYGDVTYITQFYLALSREPTAPSP